MLVCFPSPIVEYIHDSTHVPTPPNIDTYICAIWRCRSACIFPREYIGHDFGNTPHRLCESISLNLALGRVGLNRFQLLGVSALQVGDLHLLHLELLLKGVQHAVGQARLLDALSPVLRELALLLPAHKAKGGESEKERERERGEKKKGQADRSIDRLIDAQHRRRQTCCAKAYA